MQLQSLDTMARTYSHVVPNIYSELDIGEEPELPADVSFTRGEVIRAQLPSPLVYDVPYTEDEQLPHFESPIVPVMSSRLVTALRKLGVDNLQLFPAELCNLQTGQVWKDFFAVNVVGLISCTSSLSDAAEVATRPGGGKLLTINELVIDAAKAAGAPIFRLAESPSKILLATDILDAFDRTAPPGGWGITAYPTRNV